MFFLKKYIYQILIFFLLVLLVYGYVLNKYSSTSKKNEISNFAQQLKTRNSQLSKIQKNLFEEGMDINDLINKDEINFKKIFDNKKLIDFNGYNFSKDKIDKNLINGYLLSKYITNDILFSGNLGAVGTAYIDFFDNDESIFLATSDGIFASGKLTNLRELKKIDSNIKNLVVYEKFYFNNQYGIKDILIDNDNIYVSYIGERENNCYDLKIITSKINKDYLNFKKFHKTSTCVNENNAHGFWAHQGAGGRIIKLDDNNLLLNLPIAPWEAALGAKITVPTLAGKINLTIPAGAKSGQKMRLKGRGLPSKNPGDQIIILQIMTPPADSDKSKQLYQEMAEELNFNPRHELEDNQDT